MIYKTNFFNANLLSLINGLVLFYWGQSVVLTY